MLQKLKQLQQVKLVGTSLGCRRICVWVFWIFRSEIHLVGLYKRRYLQKADLFESLTQKTRQRIFVVVAKKTRTLKNVLCDLNTEFSTKFSTTSALEYLFECTGALAAWSTNSESVKYQQLVADLKIFKVNRVCTHCTRHTMNRFEWSHFRGKRSITQQSKQ